MSDDIFDEIWSLFAPPDVIEIETDVYQSGTYYDLQIRFHDNMYHENIASEVANALKDDVRFEDVEYAERVWMEGQNYVTGVQLDFHFDPAKKTYFSGTDGGVGFGVAPDYVKKDILPGTPVYSKMFNLSGVVRNMMRTGRKKWYHVKFYTPGGAGILPEHDLTPHKKVAKKSNSPMPGGDYDSLDHQTAIISQARKALVVLDNVLEQHQDFINNPITLNVLNGVAVQLKQILGTDSMRLALAGPATGNRRYWRAVQKSLSAIGAAKGVLSAGAEELKSLQDIDADNEVISERYIEICQQIRNNVLAAKEYVLDAIQGD